MYLELTSAKSHTVTHYPRVSKILKGFLCVHATRGWMLARHLNPNVTMIPTVK